MTRRQRGGRSAGGLARAARLATALLVPAAALLVPAAVLLPAAAGAERFRLVLDPDVSRVAFELGATLHTVRGSFSVTSGDLVLDEAGGRFSGRVVVDATSGRTGNERRDANMHEKVLESGRHPEIVLVPETFTPTARSDASLAGEVVGRIEIHGESHPLRFAIEAVRVAPGRGRVRGSFDVPYVAWGMRDLSTFVLRVDDTLRVEFEALGVLSSGSGAAGATAGPARAAPPAPTPAPPAPRSP